MSPPTQRSERVQIAASNQTALAFLGGPRPSWISGAPKGSASSKAPGVKSKKPAGRAPLPSARPAQEKQADPDPSAKSGSSSINRSSPPASRIILEQQPSTAISTSDAPPLPSPALTNEPSPAISTRCVSPEETIDEPPPENPETEPLSTDRETANPAAAPTETSQPDHSGMIVADETSEQQTNGAAPDPRSNQSCPPDVQRQPSQGPGIGSVAAAPSPKPAFGSRTTSPPETRADLLSATRKRSRPSTDSGSGSVPPRLRPILQGPTSPSVLAAAPAEASGNICTIWVSQIDRCVESCGGWPRLGGEIGRPRFKYLRDACLAGDLFYVFLHQLLCLWSLDANKVYRTLAGLHPQIIDAAFKRLLAILRPNHLLTYGFLAWFANFPQQLNEQLQLRHTHMMVQLGHFLGAFNQNWERLLADSRSRKYPLMAVELGPNLYCESNILQGTLFTVSRRMVGVGDSVAGPLNALFCQDQADEMKMHRENLPADHVTKFRNERAANYHAVTAQAKRRSSEPNPNPSAEVPGLGATVPAPLQLASQNQPAGPAQRAATHYQQPTHAPQILPSQLIPPNVNMPLPVLTSNGHVQAPSSTPQTSTGNQRVVPPHILTQVQHLVAGQVSPTVHVQPQIRSPLPPTQNQSQSQSRVPPITSNMGQLPYRADAHIPHSPHSARLQQQRPQQLQQFPQQHQASRASLPVNQQAQYSPRGVHRTMSMTLPNAHPPVSHGRPSSSGPEVRSQRGRSRSVQRIPEHEYPSSEHDVASQFSAFHLAQLRSPERRPAQHIPPTARYYQYVSGFAVKPMRFPPQTGPRTMSFTLSEEEKRRISPSVAPESSLKNPIRLYANGSLRYRLRICMCPESEKEISNSDWAVSATHWPQDIYPALNGKPLMIRRKQHFHNDLPIDLSDALIEGENAVRISFPPRPANIKQGKTYFVAVEIVQTVSHDTVMDFVKSAPPFSTQETIQEIQRRLRPSDSDDIVVEDNTLCINVTDPFSFSMCDLPVRGAACKHFECFDLRTWLETRHRKAGGRQDQLSMVDAWRCPICSLDARPNNLRIDRFLVGVRDHLRQNKLTQTKKIQVAADGNWTAEIEPEESDDEAPSHPPERPPVAARAAQQTSSVYVIEIDDD